MGKAHPNESRLDGLTVFDVKESSIVIYHLVQKKKILTYLPPAPWFSPLRRPRPTQNNNNSGGVKRISGLIYEETRGVLK